MSDEAMEANAHTATQPSAQLRKPWLRPYYELANLDETENGPLGGVDASSSVS